MYIPDPIELMEAQEERLAWEWEAAQKGVPEGFYRCPYCRQLFNYEPIQVSAAPDSPVVCYECLPEDLRKAYDSVFEREANSREKSC